MFLYAPRRTYRVSRERKELSSNKSRLCVWLGWGDRLLIVGDLVVVVSISVGEISVV